MEEGKKLNDISLDTIESKIGPFNGTCVAQKYVKLTVHNNEEHETVEESEQKDLIALITTHCQALKL